MVMELEARDWFEFRYASGNANTLPLTNYHFSNSAEDNIGVF